MNDAKKKRYFSNPMRSVNSPFLPAKGAEEGPVNVAFVLLENFSMMTFTAAVDALVTANLVRTAPLFNVTTFGLESPTVISDLSIEIATSDILSQLSLANPIDMLIVCGGFRCSIAEHLPLSAKLRAAAKENITLGGLWNGAIALARAGLLDNHRCALHPDNHAYMREKFADVTVSDQTLVLDEKRATSAGPNSGLEMMLMLIEQVKGKEIVRAIREIISCDKMAEGGKVELLQPADDPSLPEVLRNLLQLMSANIEEPLGLDELAAFAGVSRRHVERLFQNHLEATPSRYYLELRITHARRLLLQSNATITDISVACGFLSPTHFSHCFKDYFGVSPSQARQNKHT